MEKHREFIVSVRSVVLSDKDEVLLVQRSKDDLHNASKWELPGGKIDAGAGETIEETQIREIEEETSLLIKPDNDNAHVENYVIKDGKDTNALYLSIIGLAQVVKGEVELSKEHEGFTWANQETLGDYDLTKISISALRHFGRIK